MNGARKVGDDLPTEYLDQLAEQFDRIDAGELPWEEATDVTIDRPELRQVSIRLPRNDLAKLKVRAAQAGVGYTTLIRMVLRQYLHRPSAR